MLLRPEVVSFLDIVTRSEGLELRFEQAVVPAGFRASGTNAHRGTHPA